MATEILMWHDWLDRQYEEGFRVVDDPVRHVSFYVATERAIACGGEEAGSWWMSPDTTRLHWERAPHWIGPVDPALGTERESLDIQSAELWRVDPWFVWALGEAERSWRATWFKEKRNARTVKS